MKLCVVFVCSVVAATTLLSCGATKEFDQVKFEYIAPDAQTVTNTRTYRAPYDQCWEAVVAFFAEKNITIHTIEKASGIIAAQRIYADVLHASEIVLPGVVITRTFHITQKKRPDGFVGSANPAYVREYGKVVEEKRELLSTTESPASYRVTMKFNVFARTTEAQEVLVSINIQYDPVDALHGRVPQPQSNGAFEAGFFKFLDRHIKPQS